MNPSASFLAGRQNIGSEVEISTIEKQRRELQLLIGELKDRDRELNDMVAVHQRQLLSWEEDRQKVLTLEERCSKLEDLVEKQKSWSLGGKIQTEPENKSTFCKIHAKSPKGNGGGIQNEEKQRSETSTSVADEKWHDVSLYLGLASCSGSKQPEKLDVKCQDHLERSGVSCCHKSEACLDESDVWESKCCHPSNFIIEAPGHLSDVEWMSIFKPSRVQRVVRHKSVCTCSESASGTKYNSSTSELIASQQSHCLGSSKSALREDEKLIETESSSDKKNSSKILLVNKDAALPSEKDDFSPTSKLQRLLAESRQMVTDLELSTLLPISSENLSSSAKNNVEVSEESAEKNTLLSN
ncbi:coiled-coil domain-containing protein 62 isoform X1 [Lagenorhynchus albirostris]|uniref:coiled-coil domain-containing protein 62 isoform X1 n=1 Tax=Lagenorhynchus albirostris TaxID=27610 RepID=UPI0028E61AB2|nr:coiled-coil domain-containing protein 62 isoform X1 [Lagenorhynchus albirostris]